MQGNSNQIAWVTISFEFSHLGSISPHLDIKCLQLPKTTCAFEYIRQPLGFPRGACGGTACPKLTSMWEAVRNETALNESLNNCNRLNSNGVDTYAKAPGLGFSEAREKSYESQKYLNETRYRFGVGLPVINEDYHVHFIIW